MYVPLIRDNAVAELVCVCAGVCEWGMLMVDGEKDVNFPFFFLFWSSTQEN